MSIEAHPTPIVTPEWSRAPWMPYALHELGVREVSGAADNPRVVEYLATCTKASALLHDETAWCSAFANWCMKQAGLDLSRTHSLAARSWLHWGVETVAPFPGCVCVFWRDDPHGPHGHVAFWVGAHDDQVLVLGGNQGNCVSVKPYPAKRLLAYRALYTVG